MSSFAIYGMHTFQNYQFLQNTATLCPWNQETYERENIANFWPNSIFLNMTGCLLLQFLGSIHNTVQKISASSQLQPLPPWELPSREKLGTLVSAMEKSWAHSYQHDSVFGKQEPFFVMVGLTLTRLFMIIMMSLINDHVRQRRMMTRMMMMIWSTGKKSSAWWWPLVLPNFLWCALWITLWSRWRHLWWWWWCWSWFVYFQLSFLKLSATEWRWHRQELWVIVEGILCTASHLFTEHSSISIFNFPLVFATWTARKCKMIKLFAFAQVLHAVSGNLHS